MAQKTLKLTIDNPRLIGGENTIEGIMCFSTLFSKQVEGVTNVDCAKHYYESLGFNGCTKCKFADFCAACDINR